MNKLKSLLVLILLCSLSSLAVNAKSAPGEDLSDLSVSMEDIQNKLYQVNSLMGVDGAIRVVLSEKSSSRAIFSELEAVENSLYSGQQIDFDNLIHIACGGGIKECN